MCREPEFELLDCAAHAKLGVMCWSPLKGGWLSGKFKRGVVPDTASRVGQVEAGTVKRLQSNPSYSEFADSEKIWAILARLEEIALAHGRTVPQVALKWLMGRPVVASTVIGVRTEAQLADNLAAAEPWKLTDEQTASLSEVSLPKVR